VCKHVCMCLHPLPMKHLPVQLDLVRVCICICVCTSLNPLPMKHLLVQLMLVPFIIQVKMTFIW